MTMTGSCVGLFLMTCTFTAPDAPPAAVCPPVRTWSRAFQRQLAAELRAAPGTAMAKVVVQAIGDRDIARACARAKR